MEVREPLSFEEIAGADEFWDGEMDAFDVGDAEVLVVRIDGAFHAYNGICPHQSISLVDGRLDGEVLTCSAHEWQFNARTGLGINPAAECLVRHAVEVRDGRIFVSVEPLGPANQQPDAEGQQEATR
jgi:nitrite reductase/ring-hydroxylating ferredoxin subunit